MKMMSDFHVSLSYLLGVWRTELTQFSVWEDLSLWLDIIQAMCSTPVGRSLGTADTEFSAFSTFPFPFSSCSAPLGVVCVLADE